MSASSLSTIQTQMKFYGYPIVMGLGSFGNIFILIFFNRQQHNACSLYLMNSAITNQLYLLASGFLEILFASGYDETLRTLVLCKFTVYIPNFLGQVAKTIVILACIDRYMITSRHATVRAFSTPKRAKYLICFSYVFWFIAASHTPIWTTTRNGECIVTGTYVKFYTFYIILFVGLIPSTILFVFGYLTYRNMKQLHRRVQPTGQDRSNTNIFLQRRDRDLLVLVTSEVFAYFITTSLFLGILLEMMISSYLMLNKSLQYVLTEIFILSVAVLLLFIYSAISFYTYMILSKSFRRDFKQLIMKRYRDVTRQVPA